MSKEMSEQEFRQIAAQLRKPEGEMGIMIANRMNEGNKPMNLHTLAVVDPQPGDKILEIGMGKGLFVKNILCLDDSITYCGIDYSEEMVNESIAINPDYVHNGRAKFINAGAGNLPFPDNSFNKIFTINTLYFWDDYTEIFNELKRLLFGDGLLIISIRPKHNMLNFPPTQFGFRLFSKEDAVQLLESNSFSVLEITEIKEPPQVAYGKLTERETLILKCTPQNNYLKCLVIIGT